MANNQYPDLGITQKQDGEYWDIVIPQLDLATTYGVQFAWVYKDKDLGVSDFSDVFEFTTPTPVRPEVTNVVFVWEGTTLKGTWDNASSNAKTYQIYLTAVGTSINRSWTMAADHTQVKQTWKLTEADNIGNFQLVFRKQFTGYIKTTYLDGTTSGVAFTTPIYQDPICTGTIADSDWTVLSVPNGISVSWNDTLSKSPIYNYSNVYVSSSQSGPWTQYSGKSPIQIPLFDFNTYYVKINHFSKSECESIDSSIKQGKAYDPITFDVDPPDSVAPPVTAAWNTDKALVVSYKMPAQNLPTYVKIFLTYNGTTKWFEKTVTSSTANASTSSIINKQEFIDAFGELPSSFSVGYITDMDVYRNENTTPVAISNITTAVKPNPLLGKITTISVTSMSNGYVVSSNLDSKATGIKVYQSSSENGTYTLVASSSSSPVIIYDDLNAGNTVWVKAQWTSEDGNATMSVPISVVILDVAALSLIENPIKIATNGSIFAGTLDVNNDPVLSHARMVINKRGLFLYDDNDSNGTNPTTQIIGDWNGTTATFITQKAKIGNWIVGTNKLENLLSATVGTYTGLSPSGAYAFWAGSGVSGGYSSDSTQDAKFSVTPSGSVTARNIRILGGEIQVGSKFTVDTQGTITAVDANLSGTIKASSGILGSMDIGGTINGQTVDGQLRVNVTGNNGGKVEIGKFTTNLTGTGITTVGAGLQVTNTNGAIYAQLDPTNGIIARQGFVGGWKITATTLSSDSNKVGMYAPTTPQSTDVAFWAGGPELDTSGSSKFSVKYSGKLKATDADIFGTITSNQAKFGTINMSDMTLNKGWYVDEGQIISGGSSASGRSVYLDGEWGAISGANILGSVFYLTDNASYQTDLKQAATNAAGESLAATYGTDYISSSGNFRLGGGKIRYSQSSGLIVNANLTFDNNDYFDITGGSFSIANGIMKYNNGLFTLGEGSSGWNNFKIKLSVYSNYDGTNGDTTIVRDKDGYLTTGRAFYYGGGRLPNGASNRLPTEGGQAFVPGDIWMSRA